MKFSRWQNTEGRSWSFRLLERDNTALNKMYWSYVPTNGYIEYIYKKNDRSKNPETFELLKIDKSHADARRVEKDLESWSASYKQFNKAVRLNNLIAATSYFDLYLQRAIRFSIISDPGIIFGSARSMDGVTLLKSGNHLRVPVSDILADITKGTWPKRAAAFKKYFGSVPKYISDNLAELEKIRNMRNSIAHHFGRQIDDKNLLTLSKEHELNSLTAKTMIKRWETIYKAAASIDEYLVSKHIGEFELIYYYHELKRDNKVKDSKSFKKLIGSTKILQPKSKEYCEELIKYYNSL